MAKSERPLTEAETRRAEAFKVKEEELYSKGYKRVDLTISILKANVVGVLLTLPFVAALAGLYIYRYGSLGFFGALDTEPVKYFIGIFIFIISYIPLAALHEGIHGLCWSFGAEHGFKDIEFGFIKQNLTPYCTCSSPLKKSIYIFGSLMPMTVIGIGLGILAILIGNPLILLIAFVQTMGGAGDILISVMLVCHKTSGKDSVLLDHPTECGLVVFEREKA